MAKGDVVLKFDANTAAYVQKMLAANAAMNATAETSRKMGHEVVKSGEVMKDVFGGVADALGVVTTVAGAAAAGVTLLIKGVNDQMQKMEERANALRNKSNSLIEASFHAGLGNKTSGFRSEIEKATSDRFSGEEMTRVAASVLNGSGAKAGPQKIDSVLRGAMSAYQQARNAGANEAEGTDVANQFARLSRAGIDDPNLAYAAHVYGLDDSDMAILNRTKAAGGDARGALRIILAGHTKDERLKALLKISDVATKRKVPIQDLISHPERLPLAMRSEARDLAGAMNSPLPTMNDLDRGGAIPVSETQQRDFESRATTMADQSKELDAEADRMAQANRTMITAARAKDHPWLPSFFSDFAIPGKEETRVNQEIDRRWKDMRSRQQHETGESSGGDSQAQILKDIHQTLQEQNATLRTRRDTTLSNDNEGQK